VICPQWGAIVSVVFHDTTEIIAVFRRFLVYLLCSIISMIGTDINYGIFFLIIPFLIQGFIRGLVSYDGYYICKTQRFRHFRVICGYDKSYDAGREPLGNGNDKRARRSAEH
jgi:hypothetical protein